MSAQHQETNTYQHHPALGSMIPLDPMAKSTAGSVIPPDLTIKLGEDLGPPPPKKKKNRDKNHNQIFDPIGSHDINEVANMCTGL